MNNKKFNVGDFIHFIASKVDDAGWSGPGGFDEDWGIIISSHADDVDGALATRDLRDVPHFEIHWVKDGHGSGGRYALAFLDKYCNVLARSE